MIEASPDAKARAGRHLPQPGFRALFNFKGPGMQ